ISSVCSYGYQVRFLCMRNLYQGIRGISFAYDRLKVDAKSGRDIFFRLIAKLFAKIHSFFQLFRNNTEFLFVKIYSVDKHGTSTMPLYPVRGLHKCRFAVRRAIESHNYILIHQWAPPLFRNIRPTPKPATSAAIIEMAPYKAALFFAITANDFTRPTCSTHTFVTAVSTTFLSLTAYTETVYSPGVAWYGHGLKT